MRLYQVILTTIFFLALNACGGGGSGATPPPPPVAPPSPVVNVISPEKASLGVATVFSVTGSNLVDGMKFTLSDCVDIVELSGGTSTQRQFRCTPNSGTGPRVGRVYANADATAPLLSISVDYRALVAFFTNLSWRYAVIKVDGSLWSWNPQQTTAVKVGDNYADVAVSTYATLAIKTDGALWSWGSDNQTGIQGNGTTSASAEPMLIGTDFVKVVVKGENTNAGESAEALKKDGSLWVWGARSLMQPNATDPELAPRMIGSGFVDIARGTGGGSMGIKSDGSLWTWNRNISDQPFFPVKIGDGYVAIATSFEASYALRADGSLWNWDRLAPNQGGTIPPTASAPVKIGDGFVSISAGAYYAIAVKSDGTLWAGGDGQHGEFGNGSPGGAFQQVNVGIAAAWAGSGCSFVKKVDGSLWAAGYCDLGDGKFFRYIYTLEQVTL